MTPATFKAIRELLGLSAQWLAEAVGVDQRTVRRWEAGSCPVRPDVVLLLSRLEAQMTAVVDAYRRRVGSDLDVGDGGELAPALAGLAPEEWPVAEVPRVDDDVRFMRIPAGITSILGAKKPPAAYWRAAAMELYRELGGRLRLTYIDTGLREDAQ